MRRDLWGVESGERRVESTMRDRAFDICREKAGVSHAVISSVARNLLLERAGKSRFLVVPPRNDNSETLSCCRKPRSLGLCMLAMVLGIVLASALTCYAQDNVAKPSSKAGLFDIDSSGTDIKFVLEALARRSGANIVVSPDIAGEVSVHLKQMTIDSILEHLATVQGFAWEKSGETYLVAGKEKFAKPVELAPPATPEIQTLVWQCKHSKPADLVTVIAKLLPELKVVEGPNMITPALHSASGGGMGGGESSDSGSSSDHSTSTETAKSNSSALILMGLPSDIIRAGDILAQLDTPRRQVSIDVSITEINTSSGKDLGTAWSWADIGLTEDTTTSGIWFGKFTKNATNVTAKVSALIESGSAKLLAQPNISVLDNECAEILIGDRILYAKLAGYDNGIAIYDKEEEKVGIYLQIAPKIAGDSDVVLTLYPQVSLVTGYLKTQAGDYPQISTREAKTTVSVKNGATLAIGGLLRDDEIKNSSKVPLLGDLPIIGSLFRHSKTTKERTEIVIFLTPKIVEDK
ncbi:MAG: type II secretion system protein GspD [Armatimonadota bacterium]